MQSPGEQTGIKFDPVAGFDIRPVEAADAAAICELFNKTFPDTMSLAHWRWKYEREQSRAIVVYKNGKLIAHYGGVGTDIRLEGKASTAIQVTDLMVDPEARHAVRSQSPFYLSARSFLDSYVGFGNPFFLGYGFPSERAMGLSEKLGLFAPVGAMVEMTWSVADAKQQSMPGIIKLDNNNFPAYAEKIDRLWHKFNSNFSGHFICRKDAGFFRWRYLDHPARTYGIYLVQGRFTRKPKYLLVLRHDKGKSMLMDFLGSTLDVQPVIALAKQIAGSLGNKTLVTWCSDGFRLTFAVEGAKEKPLPIAIPANIFSPGLSPERQKHKWWFMPGDTDYL